MITLKLIAPIITFIVVFFTFSLDHIWRDKRTKKYRHAKRVLILMMIIGAIATSFIVITDNQEIHEIKNDLDIISRKLDPIIEFTRERFPNKTDEEATELIISEIKKLVDITSYIESRTSESEAELEAIKKFSGIATWSFRGEIETGGGVSFSSPVSGWTDNYVLEENGKITWKCNADALTHYKQIIEQKPDYPFPYVLISLCLKNANQPSWDEYANQGLDILAKTTSIANHSPSHDFALKILQEAL